MDDGLRRVRIRRRPVTADAWFAMPSTAEVRAWARANGIAVPDRGKLRPDVWMAWQTTHQQ